MTTASPPLPASALARGAPRPSGASWRATALSGTLMLFGGNGLVTWAEQHVASGIAAVRGGVSGSVDVAAAFVVVLASAFWALGSLASRRTAVPDAPVLAAGMQMLTGGTAMLLVGSVSGEWARVDVSAISARSVGALAYLAVVGSVVAVVLGGVFAGEVLDRRTLVASCLILVAVVCLYAAGRKTGLRRAEPLSSTTVPHADVPPAPRVSGSSP